MNTEGQTSETRKQPRQVLPLFVVVLVLSLVTWVAFEMGNLHLDPPGTTVVVGVWFAVVFLTRLLWSRIRNNRKKSAR